MTYSSAQASLQEFNGSLPPRHWPGFRQGSGAGHHGSPGTCSWSDDTVPAYQASVAPAEDDENLPGASGDGLAGTGFPLSTSGTGLNGFAAAALPQGGAGYARSWDLLSGVPAYQWYHGCGPTAAASVLGYYDVHGYPQYFNAQGWDAVSQMQDVEDQISSPAHNVKYDPTPDDAALPVPPETSLADFLHTSENPLGYGSTYLSNMAPGIEAYAAMRGAPVVAWSEDATASTWTEITQQILGDHPMIFLVDTNGDGITDHFVPVFGFATRPDGSDWFAAYTTWHENESVDWFQFKPMAAGNDWGVGYVTFVDPAGTAGASSAPVGSPGASAGKAACASGFVDPQTASAGLPAVGNHWLA